MTRLCVSIPAHEELPVVFDQIDNVRAFLPSDTVIVVHLAHGLADPATIAPMLPQGVYVNETSMPTIWGNVVDSHNSNFSFALQREHFDYFVLHASNDLYIRPGAERYIASADAGMHQMRVHPMHEPCGAGVDIPPDKQHTITCNSEPLQEMTRDLGMPEVLHTQPEGTFFRTEMFAEMVRVIGRYWEPGPGALFAPEHFFYPTVATAIGGRFVAPIVYSDAHMADRRHPLTPALINALREKRYIEDPVAEVVATFGVAAIPPVPRQYDFSNIYAVKRVPRVLHHPLRSYIRGLARQERPRLRLTLPDQVAEFVVLAFIDELLDAGPDLLRELRALFRGPDEATLVVFIPEVLQTYIPELERAVERAGLMDPEALSILGLVRRDSVETHLLLAASCDVVLSSRSPEGLYYDNIHVHPKFAHRLPLMAAAMRTGRPGLVDS